MKDTMAQAIVIMQKNSGLIRIVFKAIRIVTLFSHKCVDSIGLRVL